MLFKIAWRNLWRNKRRSLIILASMVIGVVAIILADTLSIGMMQQILDNQIGSQVSHLQIHKMGFNDNKIIQNVVPDYPKVEAILNQHQMVERYSKRLISYGLVSSATNSAGAQIVAVDPQAESEVTKIDESIISGKYLSGQMNEIIIGKKLAEKIDVQLGDKIVGMASSLDGSVGSDAFRIVGIFRTFSSAFDQSTVYISIVNGQRMLEVGDQISEFAVLVNDLDRVDELDKALTGQLGSDYEVLTYGELIPLAVMQIEIYKESMFIFYGIIGLALVFGIINTMLMSVFERIQEFGVLMAIGLRNRKLFLMVLVEAFVLGVFGTLIGFGLGLGFYGYLADSGIDLSVFSESLNSFGSGTVIYPVLTMEGVLNSLLVIPVFAVLGAIYPALKAARLDPIHAIRYV